MQCSPYLNLLVPSPEMWVYTNTWLRNLGRSSELLALTKQGACFSRGLAIGSQHPHHHHKPTSLPLIYK